MTCGEELIMFNVRVLKFEVGAFTLGFKGVQPRNRTKITEHNVSDHV